MTTESLRVIGKRWYDEFCKITGIDNRDIAVIQTNDKVDFEEATIDKLDVKELNIEYDKSYDVILNHMFL